MFQNGTLSLAASSSSSPPPVSPCTSSPPPQQRTRCGTASPEGRPRPRAEQGVFNARTPPLRHSMATRGPRLVQRGTESHRGAHARLATAECPPLQVLPYLRTAAPTGSGTMSQNEHFLLSSFFDSINPRRKETSRVKKKRLDLSFRMVQFRAKKMHPIKSYPRLSAVLPGLGQNFRFRPDFSTRLRDRSIDTTSANDPERLRYIISEQCNHPRLKISTRLGDKLS